MLLVTGGGGFIGSHLVARLVADGRRVRVLDNFATGRRENLAHVLADIELVESDLRDPAAVRHAVAGVEVIFHEAALPSVPRSIEDPATTLAVNLTGTLNLLLAARDAGCRRVVFASSSSVYGDARTVPKVETMAPAPRSPYAVSKLSGEQLCAVFSQLYGLETVALRYFNVFGPRQDPASPYAAVIPRFIRALRRGEAPVIYGDGEQTRDFTHVANVVDANLRAATAPDVTGRVFNVAGGGAISVNRVLQLIAELLETPARARYEPPRPGDVRQSRADITAARAALGYVPSVSFAEGLAATVTSHRELGAVAG
ncbi:MAG TPA: NAD-dependent epimerase/dehydratase family protein [Thermomicrobiaceae bacterium]|nr:NAD-dependent epimerase/dehydratase family protein [Thermomicrobiaceae bacterium]